MDTNFKMLKELLVDFVPKNYGVLSDSEVKTVENALHLHQMDVLQLRNLRDFTVLYFDVFSKGKRKTMEQHDKLSGIVAVIDQQIFRRGGEV